MTGLPGRRPGAAPFRRTTLHARLPAVLLPAVLMVAGGPAAAAAQETPPGLDTREMAAIDDLLAVLEEAFEDEEAAALGRLFHPRGRLSDWRGRLARGPAEVEAAYREAFRALRGTTSFRLEDGREVRLGRSPQVALDVRLVVGAVRPLGDTAAVVDGDWRTEGALSPTGAPLTGEGSRQGEGGPPYTGAYRLVAVLAGERATVGLFHSDRYRATVDPAPAPAPEPGPEPAPPEPAPPEPESAPGAASPPPSSPVYFGTTFENYAWGVVRVNVCTLHPDGTVTVAHGDPERAETGEVVGDTLGRLPADSVARYTRLVREGVAPEPGPIERGGTADAGTTSFWVAAPVDHGGGDHGGGRWRVALASAGDVPRRGASSVTRQLASWIYSVLDEVQDGECMLRFPPPATTP